MSDDNDEKENYCEQHDVDIDALPADYDFCPYCREESKREAELQHQVTRDPTLEPW